MKKVLIVGIRPSYKNYKSTVPFEGTSSSKRLALWFRDMKVKCVYLNLNDVPGNSLPSKPQLNLKMLKFYMDEFSFNKVFALGDFVSKTFKQINIDHIKLPHPSGRNRMFNDPQQDSKIINVIKESLNAREIKSTI